MDCFLSAEQIQCEDTHYRGTCPLTALGIVFSLRSVSD